MGMFDPNQLMDMQIEESSSTEFVPVPVGEFIGIAEEAEVNTWASQKDPSKSGLRLDIKWSIDDQGVKDLLERDKVSVKQSIMLDLTETGGLDMGKGKNVNLGRLREALDLNKPGEPFGFRMIPGRMAKVRVEHRLVDGVPYAEIKAVAKIS